MPGAPAFLRKVPVFAGLSDDLLEKLAEELREIAVSAGTWIMRAGDTANSLFIIRGGRPGTIFRYEPWRTSARD